jgi:hypothetical protein
VVVKSWTGFGDLFWGGMFGVVGREDGGGEDRKIGGWLLVFRVRG